MRRLFTAIVVPVALITAIAITAAAADAGNKPTSAKSGVKIKSATTPPPDHTWVFKGKVTSRNEKCLGKRRVAIFVSGSGKKRGSIPPGPVATGKTKDNGKFTADTDQKLLLLASYTAVVYEREHKGLTCQGAESEPFDPAV